ncbi:MAG TPA: sulfotransferase [Candidatus Methylomirabilis sp.]|nr:sulfotransferase [Candidatus Methylomirabilis sp.]
MSSNLELVMLGAMYENGGNATLRFLDGHPELFVYPFESQLGTRLVQDSLTSVFPIKYRWPVFSLAGTPESDYRAIIDEECKVRARTPRVSKFRTVAFHFSDDERFRFYASHVGRTGRSRAHNVAAFFRATFEAWRNRRRRRTQRVYVGYSPIVVVDADKILADFPRGHVIHVVRNPWSAYADHQRRAVPSHLPAYMLGWTLNQYFALANRQQAPDRVHVLRFEDIVEDPLRTLGEVCEKLGVSRPNSLAVPSWNGQRLRAVYPWGAIHQATVAANRAAARRLSLRERAEVRALAGPYLEAYGYDRVFRERP